MNARDLMIGDWVKNQECLCKVISIASDGIYFEDEFGEGVCSYNRLEPVPLTPEILEKNGFVFFDDYDSYNNKPIRRYEYKRDGYKCGMSANDTDGYYFTFGIPYNGLYFNIVRALHIRSVHEFQHALRLCGIDLDIVI